MVTNTSINSQNLATFGSKRISGSAVNHDRLSLTQKRTESRRVINIFHNHYLRSSLLSNKPSALVLKGNVETMRNMAI